MSRILEGLKFSELVTWAKDFFHVLEERVKEGTIVNNQPNQEENYRKSELTLLATKSNEILTFQH